MRPWKPASLKTLMSAMLGVAICVGLSSIATAQAGSAAAALNGTVRDASGAVVPDAAITLQNAGTGFKQVTQSNSTGNYTLVNISPGHYIASVSKDGFAPEQSPDFVLSVNQTATINFDLESRYDRQHDSGLGRRSGNRNFHFRTGHGHRNQRRQFPAAERAQFHRTSVAGTRSESSERVGQRGGGGIGNYLGTVVFPCRQRSKQSQQHVFAGWNQQLRLDPRYLRRATDAR